MEGADHQSGMKQQHRTGGGAFGSPLLKPPNQKPPSHPNINISVPPPSSSISSPQLCPQRFLHSPGSSYHSRSLSQPTFVSLDSLPPLNLNPPRINSIPISTDVKLKSVIENNPSSSLNREVHNTFQGGVSVSLPPCKGHRRSSSDSPLGISGFMQSSPSSGGRENSVWKPVQPVELALKATNSDQVDGGFLNLNPPRLNSIPISTDVKLKSVIENNPSTSLNREVHNTFQGGVSVSLPPCKGHRRSSSDSPLGISSFMQSSPSSGGRENSVWKSVQPVQLALKATNSDQGDGGFLNGKREAVVAAAADDDDDDDDDLFSQYMNWENIDKMNFSRENDLDKGPSGSKTIESSDNEVDSRVNGKARGAHGASLSFSKERQEIVKRGLNGDIAPVSHHRRSSSLDSSIGNFDVQDRLPKFSPLNSQVGQFSPGSSMDNKTSYIEQELRKNDFCTEQIKIIMKSDKLIGIALAEPKRARRILSNRQSAARSKEKKAQYIAELEQMVQTLQGEKTSLSTMVTKLQRDNSDLKSENKEYKLRLQATEQLPQLKESFGGESLTNAISQQLALNQPIFQLEQDAIAQQLAPNQPRFQLQQQQPNQQ